MNEQDQRANPLPAPAWLENMAVGRVPLPKEYSIGRAKNNSLVLQDTKISRNHALIHQRQGGDFTVVDLGSVNGTYVNDRRLSAAITLQDNDRIRVGDTEFLFRQVNAPSLEPTRADKTVAEARSFESWLLVADLEGYTHLLHKFDPSEMGARCGEWFSQCKGLVGTGGGTINKYLGDGFLAHWPAAPSAEDKLVSTLQALQALQSASPLPFRLAFHFGTVLTAGIAAASEENIMGKEVNFIFRMEKLAGSIQIPRLVSEPAKKRLANRLPFSEVGIHSLKGFPSPFPFYTY